VDSVITFRDELSIAWRIAKIRIRGQMQYRASFLMQLFGNFIVNFAEVLALIFLFQRFDNLGGWTVREVIFLHAISMVTFSLGDTISNGVQTVPKMIRAGEFDRLMIRPVSIYIQAIVNDVSLRHFGLLAQGVGLFAVSVTLVDVHWTLGNILYLALMMLCGVAIFVALFTVEAVLSFWTVNSIEAVNAFTYGGSDIAQYPLHIFGKVFQRLFLWVIPLGFVCYYPALHLLGKGDPLALPNGARFYGIPTTIAFCAVVAFGWKLGLRQHKSTGS
jgi:ABC-2 type transport system permease protein